MKADVIEHPTFGLLKAAHGHGLINVGEDMNGGINIANRHLLTQRTQIAPSAQADIGFGGDADRNIGKTVVVFIKAAAIYFGGNLTKYFIILRVFSVFINVFDTLPNAITDR